MSGILNHKTVRKAENTENIRLRFTISEEDAKFLEEYSRRTGKKRPEAIRDGIKLLKDK